MSILLRCSYVEYVEEMTAETVDIVAKIGI